MSLTLTTLSKQVEELTARLDDIGKRLDAIEATLLTLTTKRGPGRPPKSKINNGEIERRTSQGHLP